MRSKSMFAFSLSTSVVEEIRALLLTELVEPVLFASPNSTRLTLDDKGLLPENYAAFQTLLRSHLTGVELLNSALTHPTLGHEARRTFIMLQKQNRKAQLRAMTPPNLSTVVEELLLRGLRTLPQAEPLPLTVEERKELAALEARPKGWTDKFAAYKKEPAKDELRLQELKARAQIKATTKNASTKSAGRKNGNARKVA